MTSQLSLTFDALTWSRCGGWSLAPLPGTGEVPCDVPGCLREHGHDVPHNPRLWSIRFGRFSEPSPYARYRGYTRRSKPITISGELVHGSRVCVARGSEVGTVVGFVEPKPGWVRAFVNWNGRSEQFVDVEKLRKATSEDEERAVVAVAGEDERDESEDDE